MSCLKSILKAIGEYLFGTIFFMGAFVTIVGVGAIDLDTASRPVTYLWSAGATAFTISLGILIWRIVRSDGESE